MNHWLRNLTLLALMLAASGMAMALRPKHLTADQAPQISYEQIIPKSFGDWIAEENKNTLVVNPQQEEQLNSLYSEIVTRTYTNRLTGKKVMLSIAYGADQTRNNQVHKPEVCYPAQGFQLLRTHKDQTHTDSGDIPVMRVLTRLGPRIEPVTYWIRVGDTVVRGAVEQNLARLQFGLRGSLPDGLLFRVSTIEDDPEPAYKLHDAFVGDLLKTLSPAERFHLGGQTLLANGPTRAATATANGKD